MTERKHSPLKQRKKDGFIQWEGLEAGDTGQIFILKDNYEDVENPADVERGWKELSVGFRGTIENGGKIVGYFRDLTTYYTLVDFDNLPIEFTEAGFKEIKVIPFAIGVIMEEGGTENVTVELELGR